MLTNEQKTVFAEKHLRCPEDTVMIIYGILGVKACEDDPLLPIALAQSLPNDDFVLAEKDRIKKLPKTFEEFLFEQETAGAEMLRLRQYKDYNTNRRLVAEIRGFIKKNAEDESNNNGKIEELYRAAYPHAS